MQPYYEHGGITIYHGDCRDVLQHVTYDVVITDPPYGVEFKGKATKHTKASGGYDSFNDTTTNVESVVIPIIASLVSTGQRAVVTPGSRCMFRYPEPKSVGVIFFPSGAGMNSWGFTCSQPIYYYGKDPYLATRQGSRPDSFSSTERSEQNGHPCPKPIGTMRWLVRRGSLAGEMILDPFMGSGTTLLAAQLEGRKAIGIEIEERYCEIAAKRLQQEVLPLEVPA
jgi:DNA modification methylase